MLLHCLVTVHSPIWKDYWRIVLIHDLLCYAAHKAAVDVLGIWQALGQCLKALWGDRAVSDWGHGIAILRNRGKG